MPLTLVAIVVAVVAWVWLRNQPASQRLLPSLLRGGLGRVAGGAGAKSGNQSHVSSDILEMTLDHDSGIMSGKIIKGPMEGRELAELSESEFLELLRYCRGQDEDSARLLETWPIQGMGQFSRCTSFSLLATHLSVGPISGPVCFSAC